MMRRLAVLAFVAVAILSSIISSSAQTDKFPNLITVSGEGEVAIVPDLAILSGGVTTTGKTAREASEANAKMMTAVMAALKAAGVAEQDVQTSRLSLHPLRDNNRSDLRVVGFQASNQVTIKVRDTAKIADVIDRLVAAGANDISGIQFVVSSPSKPLDQAREAAIADARRKAEIYARAANIRLGPPVSITEEGSAAPGPVLMRAAKSADTPVSPGEEIQRISVSVSYELLR
jgi:uncharacterized protein YggE